MIQRRWPSLPGSWLRSASAPVGFRRCGRHASTQAWPCERNRKVFAGDQLVGTIDHFVEGAAPNIETTGQFLERTFRHLGMVDRSVWVGGPFPDQEVRPLESPINRSR